MRKIDHSGLSEVIDLKWPRMTLDDLDIIDQFVGVYSKSDIHFSLSNDPDAQAKNYIWMTENNCNENGSNMRHFACPEPAATVYAS